MICGNCGEDFSDSYNEVGGSKRKVLGPLDHYMSPFQIKGMYCPKCNQTMEYITTCTGNAFHKSAPITDEKMLYSLNDYWKFLENNNLIDDFRKFAGEHLRLKLNGGQHDLFNDV